MRRVLIAPLIVLLAGGCAGFLNPSRSCDCAVPAWTQLMRTTDELAEAGRFGAADSALVAFALAHPGRQEAHEVAFWRAVYRLDPRNPLRHPEAGLQLLDLYLQSDSVHWYRTEARLMRDLAAPTVTAYTPAPPPPPGTTPATARIPVRTEAAAIAERDAEIQQLRERVTRLNEELERIRRRLAAPQSP
jgi:hypothetical protein